MEPLIQLVVIGFVVGAFWFAWQRRYSFMIQLDAGVPRVTRGKVTAAFLDEIRQVCDEAGVSRGWVGGLPRGRRMALVFSRSIPPACQQRLRNLWSLVR